MEIQRNPSIESKINFVKQIEAALLPVQHNLESISYDVFCNTEHNHCKEYLVITYRGGARTVRNCTGNSYSAIFTEISRYLDDSYYKEVEFYDALTPENGWHKI